MEKVMDFFGSGELMRAILTDHHTHDALTNGNAGKKFCVLVCVEDDEQTDPCHEDNDLKVSICDTMNLADSFLKDIRATELAYAENQHKTLWTEADEERMRVVFSNGNDGEVYKQDDGWITHDGGCCPVHPDTLVDATFHGGAYSIRPLIAGGLQWNNTHSNYSVDRYRIVQDMSHEDEEAQV